MIMPFFAFLLEAEPTEVLGKKGSPCHPVGIMDHILICGPLWPSFQTVLVLGANTKLTLMSYR